MTARTHADQRRLTTCALVGSVAVHAAAVLLLSAVRLAPVRLPQASTVRFFEVRLQEPPPVVALPRPRISPRLRIQQGPEIRQPPAPTMRSIPRPKPAQVKPASSDTTTQPRRPAAATPASRPAAQGGGQRPRTLAHHAAAPAPAAAHARLDGPSGGGGPVDLGSPSPAGDIGGLGSGSTPVGTVPGTGTGSGSGTGPGSGPGPPGTAAPSTITPPDKQPGAGSSEEASPQAKPEPRPEPKPAHVSRLADRALPELIKRVNPQYPASAAAEGVEGTVSLIVTVGTDGNVEKVSVSKSSGDARLDSAAVAAVKKWKYKPAVQDGIARTVDTSATVTFRLN